ncbi:hypothetical protein Q5P01_019411 [Channa striata]|uniref:Uncharacterized protein n=1 Tax=Channa striata TaxID=64152 RepID=A0AA88M322_CHASR|nr:hypothetical protein Q5P01_019411 [Channa striata]
MKAAESDNRAALDGHMLTGGVASDEQEDTTSPLLFGQKTSKLADLSGSHTLRNEYWGQKKKGSRVSLAVTKNMRSISLWVKNQHVHCSFVTSAETLVAAGMSLM